MTSGASGHPGPRVARAAGGDLPAAAPVRGLRALLRDSGQKPVAIVRMVVVGKHLPRVVLLRGGAYLLHPDSVDGAPVYQFEMPYRAGDSFTEFLAELPS
jgi:hypothetical protein